jgi:hypothetical protein
MSAITYDGAPFAILSGAEFATNRPNGIKNHVSREVEFRTALNTYLAEYRKNRAAVAHKTIHQSPKNQLPVGRKTAEMLIYLPCF